MNQFKFPITLLSAFAFLLPLSSVGMMPKVASAFPQEEDPFGEPASVQQVIHQTFKARLKTASLGTPVDTDSIEKEVRTSVERQIELFVEMAAKTNDEATIKIANTAGSSMTLADCMTTMIVSELSSQPLDEMEAESIRDSLDDLKVKIGWDYTVSAEAIPEDKVSVRIRLPKLHVCGGCKIKLEQSLDGLEGYEAAMVDLDTITAQFLAPADSDIEETLDELEKSGVSQLLEWELVRK